MDQQIADQESLEPFGFRREWWKMVLARVEVGLASAAHKYHERDLTPDEKFALLMSAGVPWDEQSCGISFHDVLVGFVRQEGGWQVYWRKNI